MKAATVLLQALVAAIVLWPTAAVAQTLSLTIENGRVTLDARNVSLRQILQRWSEVGSVALLNEESVPPTPVTLQLSDVTERAALDTLLRSMSGYVLGPRQPGRAGAEIASIMILPTSAAVQNTGSALQPPGRMPQSPVATAELLLEAAAVATIIEPESSIEAEPYTLFQPGGLTSGLGVGVARGATNRPPEPPARPPDQPIRFSDVEVDAEGNPARALSVPLEQSPPEDVAPKGPFGVTTGAATPGTVVPAPRQPNP